MQGSAVESDVRPEEAARFATLDDLAYRCALRQRGIRYLCSLSIGFDPAFIALHPALLPIDQFGRREAKEDCYIGLPPDRDAIIAHKLGPLERAVDALQPDGVHPGFIRRPGFWEIWLSDTKRAAMPDYCYGPETLGRFAHATGTELPTGDRKEPPRSSANTLPFFRSDFDDAVTEAFGQDVEALREAADVFEVMAYHQIMRRDEFWPAAVADDIKRRTGSTTVCTLQARPLYLDGMHAGRGRATTLPPDEFLRAVDAIEAGPVDALCSRQ